MKPVEKLLTLILEDTQNGKITWHLDVENNNSNILAKYHATYFGVQLLVGKSIIAEAPYFFSATFPENITGNLFPSEMENPFKLKALYECAAKPSNDACLNFIALNTQKEEDPPKQE